MPPSCQRRWVALLALAVLAIGARTATAEELRIGGRTIRLEVPRGWCRLDPADGADATVLRTAESLQARNRIVMMFADCRELAGLRNGSYRGYVSGGTIMLPMTQGSVAALGYASRAAYVDAVARFLGDIDDTTLLSEAGARRERQGRPR